MTLRIGNISGNAAADRRGFTLVELILVMALLTIVFAMAAPSLSNFFRGRTLDYEARRFLSLTRYGQSRAAAEGVPMVLWINPQEGTYGLEQDEGYTDDDGRAVSLALADDLGVEVESASVQSRQAASFGRIAGVGFAAQNADTWRGMTAIRFSPDGFIAETSPQAVGFFEHRSTRQDGSVWVALNQSRLNYEIQTDVWQRARR